MDNTTIAPQQLQRMKELVEQLNRASEAYYNGQGELMTDFEWDARFDELRQLEQQTATVLPDSPTHNVSRDDMAGKKEKHEFAALSAPLPAAPASTCGCGCVCCICWFAICCPCKFWLICVNPFIILQRSDTRSILLSLPILPSGNQLRIP